VNGGVLTELPAVLAVWAARRDVATPEVTADFLASRDFGLSHISEISYDASFELECRRKAIESTCAGTLISLLIRRIAAGWTCTTGTQPGWD